jgi:hypothetical protein
MISKNDYELLLSLKKGKAIDDKEYEILREYALIGYVSFGIGADNNQDFTAQAGLTNAGLELIEALKDEFKSDEKA